MTDHTREAIEQITLAHLPAAEDPFITCICGDKWMTVTEHAKHIARHIAAHVAAVVADKDAEIERLREVVSNTQRDRDGRKRQRDAAVARLGAITALVDDRNKHVRIQEDRRHDIGAMVTRSYILVADLTAVLGDSADATTKREQERLARARRWIETCVDPITVGDGRKRAMLAYLDGADDVPDDIADIPHDGAKQAQEIRAAALREAADEIDRNPLTVGLAVAGGVSAWLRARADALTDTTIARSTTNDGKR